MAGTILRALQKSDYQSKKGEERAIHLKALKAEIARLVKQGADFNTQYTVECEDPYNKGIRTPFIQSPIIEAHESCQYEIAKWMFDTYARQIDLTQEFKGRGRIFDYLINKMDYGLIESMLGSRSSDFNVNASETGRCGQSQGYLHQVMRQRDYSKIPDVNSDIYVSPINTVNALLENGADINFQDDSTLTPLMKAVEEAVQASDNVGTMPMVEFLLEKGANPNLTDKYGETALHYAAREANSKIVKLLLDKGADPNGKNNDGDLPLYLAALSLPYYCSPGCVYPCHAVMELFLDKRVDPNVQDGLGNTLWHDAETRNDLVLLKILLQSPELKILENSAKKTPFQMALEGVRCGRQVKSDFIEQAYIESAAAGNLNILRHVEQLSNAESEWWNNHWDLNKYVALTEAAANGHVDIVKHIVEQSSGVSEKQALIDTGYYQIFKAAANNGKQEVLRYLLDNGSDKQFSWVEAHDHEYGELITRDYIKEKLNEFVTVSLPLTDSQVNRGLVMLRNLIRRGGSYRSENERLDSAQRIAQLLAIDDIVARCHEPILSNHVKNELLKLAQSVGNSDAVRRLLQIEDVQRVAQEEATHGDQSDSLRRIAGNTESSMGALKSPEQALMEKVIGHYMRSGVSADAVMNRLRDHLRQSYEQYPIDVQLEGRESPIRLPFDVNELEDELKGLNLTGDELKQVHEAYCYPTQKGQERKIPYHTAYRYLLKPNPLMHPQADFVERDQETGAAWSSFERHGRLIASLYLASMDENIPVQEGSTVKERFDLYVTELACLGRAHNWDGSDEAKTKQIDDLELDRPSCYGGVVRRLVQYLKYLHGEFKQVASKDSIMQSVNSFVHKRFRDKFNECEDQQLIKKAWSKVIYAGGTDPACENDLSLLRKFNMTKNDKEDVINEILKSCPSSSVSCVLRIRRGVDDLFGLQNEAYQRCHAMKFGAIFNHIVPCLSLVESDIEDENKETALLNTSVDDESEFASQLVDDFNRAYNKRNFKNFDDMCDDLRKTRATAFQRGGFFALETGYGRWQVVKTLTGVSSTDVLPDSDTAGIKKQLLDGYRAKKQSRNSSTHDGSGAGQQSQSTSSKRP